MRPEAMACAMSSEREIVDHALGVRCVWRFGGRKNAQKFPLLEAGALEGSLLSPGCRSVGLCRALSGLCRGSVGALSGLCRLTTVGPLSASVGLCRPILTGTMRVVCRPLSVCRDSVGLSVCRSVGLCRDSVGVCRRLSTPFSSEADLTIQSKGTLLMKMVGDFAI